MSMTMNSVDEIDPNFGYVWIDGQPKLIEIKSMYEVYGIDQGRSVVAINGATLYGLVRRAARMEATVTDPIYVRIKWADEVTVYMITWTEYQSFLSYCEPPPSRSLKNVDWRQEGF